MTINDRIKGALYGIAIGDAIGAPVEFMDANQIQIKYGQLKDMVGGGWLSLKPGETTDDTQMTLAVAEGIMAAPDNPIEEIGRRFIEWVKSSPKDIGATCYTSIVKAYHDSAAEIPGCKEWFEASKYTANMNNHRSGGNGALMRTVYPGLYYNGDMKEAASMAVNIARMTHFDAHSDLACLLYTNMIYRATEGYSVSELFDYLDHTEYCREEIMDVANINPSGYVVDSFRCALNSIYTTKSFEEAIISAINLGGDADTIGAITGGLAGAIYGYNAIPDRWVEALDPEFKPRLEQAALCAIKNRQLR
jgi:ADP-ribosyl-[dinitrogen reductase] hydrolase